MPVPRPGMPTDDDLIAGMKIVQNAGQIRKDRPLVVSKSPAGKILFKFRKRLANKQRGSCFYFPLRRQVPDRIKIRTAGDRETVLWDAVFDHRIGARLIHDTHPVG